MCQERLSELATLSIEKELLTELSKNPKFYDEVIDKFANLKDRRIDVIYKTVRHTRPIKQQALSNSNLTSCFNFKISSE
jgi:hypothetical protein